MRATKPFTFGSMSRRAALTGAALATMGALSACTPKGFVAAPGDMALGAADGAKVTVVEYASVTCSHCAAWQAQVWPGFKEKYVDTNKVRYVFREFPTAPAELATAGFLTARCAGDDKYFDVVHAIMANQAELFGPAPRDVLLRIANAAGLSEDQFVGCLSDKAAAKAADDRLKAGIDAGVQGTPAFFVNGVKVDDVSLAGLSQTIDAELVKN